MPSKHNRVLSTCQCYPKYTGWKHNVLTMTQSLLHNYACRVNIMYNVILYVSAVVTLPTIVDFEDGFGAVHHDVDTLDASWHLGSTNGNIP